MNSHSSPGVLPPPVHLFPLIRHLSYRTTPVLIRLSLTPNQITLAALLTGLGCAWLLSWGDPIWSVAAALLLVLSYILDNCDGEVARARSMSTRFGGQFDTFTDWAVNGFFFAALGMGTAHAHGAPVWAWLGWIASAGATINYVLVLVRERRGSPDDYQIPGAPEDSATPETWQQRLLFAFRELSRADFCFIVLTLSAADSTWLLLPAGAVGAQAYWVSGLVKGARRYRV